MQIVCVIEGRRQSVPFGPNNPKVLVGRLQECDLVINNPKISRRHCEFKYTDRGIEIKDHGSSAGTFVNQRKIGRARITLDDEIYLADVEIKIVERAEAEPEPAPAAPRQQPTAAPPEPPPHSAASDTWELVYQDDDDNQQTVAMNSNGMEVIIGRRSDTNIRLNNPTVGRHHCKVSLRQGELRATDLKSSNGTFVNGERIQEKLLADGDVLECGTAPIKIRLIPGEATHEGETWHDEVMEDEMGPPNWFLLYNGDSDQITVTEMALKLRVLAVGSDQACEICIPDRRVELEHIELTWEYGVLVVRDLGTQVGTLLNGRSVDEVVLRNGDVLTCGDFQILLVRGSAGEVLKARTGQRSAEADFWAPLLEKHDEGISFTHIDTDPHDDLKRRELTLWPDGEATLDRVKGDERTTINGRVDPVLMETLMDGLVRAGFPDVPSSGIDEGEHPPELEVYYDSDLATVVLSRRLLERSAVYKEISQLLAAIATLISS